MRQAKLCQQNSIFETLQAKNAYYLSLCKEDPLPLGMGNQKCSKVNINHVLQALSGSRSERVRIIFTPQTNRSRVCLGPHQDHFGEKERKRII